MKPVTITLLWLSSLAFPQDCHIFNSVYGPYYYASIGIGHHSTGSHIFSNQMNGACNYTGPSSGPAGPCNAFAQATSYSAVEDSGQIWYPGFVHEEAATDASGIATATAPSAAAASAEGAGGVCEGFLSCSIGVTISGPYGSINFTGKPYWQAKHPYTNTCPVYVINNGCGGKNQSECPPICGPGNPDCRPSPILIDTKSEGWHFTDPNTSDGYVTFRFGKELKKVSWPNWRFENAWLVYDRNGVIDGADDLFGDFTAHSDGGVKGHPNPNGFLALAWYDQPNQGGNVDGVIDQHDAIWPKLRLWKPKHCHLHPDQPCVALDSELFPLDALGVHSLSLVYGGTNVSVEENLCRYQALVNPGQGETQHSKDGRMACDFNLAVRK